jgi:ABC-2 type transport system permease protein
MGNAVTIAIYELKRLSRLKSVMFVLFLMPLLLIFILGSALSTVFKVEDRVMKPVKMVIVQETPGKPGDPLFAFGKDAALLTWLDPVVMDSREAAERAVRTGEADYAVVIPEGFTEALMQGKQAEWELIRGKDHGQNIIAESVVNGYLNRINSIQATVLSQKHLGAEQLRELVKTASGPLEEEANASVEIDKLSNGRTHTAGQYYATAMLIMFMLYSGMTAAISLVQEREQHTLTRLTSMPITMNQVILGKMAGNGFLSLLQCLIIIILSWLLYGVYWGKQPLLLLCICLLVIAASMSLSTIAAIVGKTTKGVTTMFQFLIIVMTFLSGGFLPDMGQLLRSWGNFTLNHWAMQGILRIMLDQEAAEVLPYVSVLLAVSLGLMLLSFMIFRRAGYHE